MVKTNQLALDRFRDLCYDQDVRHKSARLNLRKPARSDFAGFSISKGVIVNRGQVAAVAIRILLWVTVPLSFPILSGLYLGYHRWTDDKNITFMELVRELYFGIIKDDEEI